MDFLFSFKALTQLLVQLIMQEFYEVGSPVKRINSESVNIRQLWVLFKSHLGQISQWCTKSKCKDKLNKRIKGIWAFDR